MAFSSIFLVLGQLKILLHLVVYVQFLRIFFFIKVLIKFGRGCRLLNLSNIWSSLLWHDYMFYFLLGVGWGGLDEVQIAT